MVTCRRWRTGATALNRRGACARGGRRPVRSVCPLGLCDGAYQTRASEAFDVAMAVGGRTCNRQSLAAALGDTPEPTSGVRPRVPARRHRHVRPEACLLGVEALPDL